MAAALYNSMVVICGGVCRAAKRRALQMTCTQTLCSMLTSGCFGSVWCAQTCVMCMPSCPGWAVYSAYRLSHCWRLWLALPGSKQYSLGAYSFWIAFPQCGGQRAMHRGSEISCAVYEAERRGLVPRTLLECYLSVKSDFATLIFEQSNQYLEGCIHITFCISRVPCRRSAHW